AGRSGGLCRHPGAHDLCGGYHLGSSDSGQQSWRESVSGDAPTAICSVYPRTVEGIVLDSRTPALLPDIVWRESRSLLQYVSQSFPWTTPEEQTALVEIRKIVTDEQKCVASLIRFMQRQHITVVPGASYPSAFTTVNFTSLDYLLPRLALEQKQL